MSTARIRIASRAGGAQCQVSLIEEPGGLIAEGAFELANLDGSSPTREEMRTAVRENLSADPVFVRIGEKLFEMLTKAGVGGSWRERAGQHDRTVLDIDDSLSDLPWELLCEVGRGGLVTRFFANPQRPIAREHKDLGKALAESGVLRVLIITGEKPQDDAAFPSEEVHAIRRAFQFCDQGAYLEIAEQPPSQNDLSDRLDKLRPHVLHFVGHGGLNHQTGYPGLLFGPINNPPVWSWDSDAIFNVFGGLDWVPRLVVLNACYSGQVGDASEQMMMAPVAKAFTESGVLAVVGLQATVRQDRAAQFARAFYRQLAEGKEIDRACAEVRRDLGQSDAGTGWQRRDWALPVLSMAGDPQRVFPMRPARTELRSCSTLGVFFRREGPSPFVDRSDQRRQVLNALDPFAAGEQACTCVMLTGPEGTGKSWFSKRCSRDLAHAGVIVRHCDLSQGVGLTFVDVLRQIQAGDPQQPDSVIHQPLPAEHFEDFHARVATYTGGRQDPDDIRRVCAAFRRGLAATAAGSSLLLVFDHLGEAGRGSVQPEEFKLSLLPELIKPIAAGTVPAVRLVVIGTAAEIEAYGLANVPLARIVPMANFRPGDFPSLFHEFCRFQRNEKLAKIRDYWDLVSVADEPWPPVLFQRLRADVAKYL